MTPTTNAPRPTNATPTTASLVITTKNRREELAVALRSAFAQTVPLDVIVIDDASTDGTAEMVRAEFPGARLFSNPSSIGYMAGRNRGAELATGEVIFSIDDDAELSTPHVAERTLRDFDDPRVGAVAIPFCDVKKSPEIHQRARSETGVEVVSHYIGTAHAVRRDVFLKAGSYHPEWIHQGEEMDLCLRLLALGYVVRAGHADIIRHYESPKRDLTRMHIFGRRNDILYAWYNVPLRALPIHLAGTIFLGLRMAARGGWVRPALTGVGRGLAGIATHFGRRRPVPIGVYRLMRELRRRGITPLEEIAGRLPTIPPPIAEG